MAMYRVLHTLAVKGGKYLYPGSFARLEWLDEAGIQALTNKGGISRINPPPLIILPGWADRAETLANGGIQNAEDFLECGGFDLASILGCEESEIEDLRQELIGFLSVKKPIGG